MKVFFLSCAAITLLWMTTACSTGSSVNSSEAVAGTRNAVTQTSPMPDQTPKNVVPGAMSAQSTAGQPRLEGKATIVIKVQGQPITIEVDGTQAPVTAGNFVDLVQRGVYDGTKFHRVVKTPQPFVAQGGDPQSKDPNIAESRLGSGNFIDPATDQPRFIPLEITPAGAAEPVYSKTLKSADITSPPQLTHQRGAVAMARTPLPDSASAQFYFALADLPFLDGDYAVFGYVTDGMEVVDGIQQGDVIESAEVVQGAENLQ
ncbi:peptidylprolyl isomerase [Lyngbya confervoides]|uniref:Peptidyl-prolyl cis-trans isomerase n=1 Tax=Lyngbya confervoides BDU141951 TaxID=1574623 RepID=A0ABD4SZX6_9CYAN|nr:peptidylprolyl isomerase [Lyngbya confervoides]MCM1981731.1 peptidylprolyl isomerase [Lyngbya confervoides BDU141951]